MQVALDVLKEVQNHLQSMADSLADFEFDGSQHKDYLDTIALLAKLTALRDHLGDRS
jgi:hypothetical protein